MAPKVITTLKNFISSNNAFCDALKNNQIYLDDNIIIELIIYYLTLNKNILSMLNNEEYQLLKELIFNQNYTVKEDKITIAGETVSIEYLKQLVLEIEEKLKPSLKGRILYLHDLSSKDLRIRPHHYQSGRFRTIPFEDGTKSRFYTMVDREIEYERTIKITTKTRPYIRETKDNYLALVNDIVHKAITNSLDEYSIKYLKVIASYLQMYPFTKYIGDKKYIPYEVLTIDQTKIGIRKTTYDNQDINNLKQKLVNIMRYQQQLEYEQEVEAHDITKKSHQLTLTEQEVLDVDRLKLRTMLEIYELEHSPKIYNRNLIERIAQSFEEGTISINRFFANPLLRIFLVEDNKSYFHCSIHLETLFNLINSNQLLEEIEEQKVLKLPI